MKRLSLFVLILAVLLLSACSPAVQGFVELPDGIKVRLTAMIVATVAFFFLKLVELWPPLKFLEQFRLPFSLALAAELINLIQNSVPDMYAGVAVAAITLVLEIVALVLVYVKLKELNFRAFK